MKRLFAQYIDDTTLIKVVKEIINQENIFYRKEASFKVTGKACWRFLQIGVRQSILQCSR